MSDEMKVADIDDKTLNQLIKRVHQYTGITLAPSRKTMLQGRLRPRMRELHLVDFHEYLNYLEDHSEETQIFIDLVTTNETYFYRTPRVWVYLEKEFIPTWLANNPGIVFTVWSAAASSGEEAHTLGIVLQHIKIKYPAFKYQIVGSDISGEILGIAEKGVYTGRSIEFFKNERPELFLTYMRQNSSGSFSVLPDIRQNIAFQKHNLFKTPQFKTKFDLVLIRNVLIYFDTKDQEKVLFNVSQAMKKNALLVIGESESITRLQTPFSYKMPLIYDVACSNKADVA